MWMRCTQLFMGPAAVVLLVALQFQCLDVLVIQYDIS